MREWLWLGIDVCACGPESCNEMLADTGIFGEVLMIAKRIFTIKRLVLTILGVHNGIFTIIGEVLAILSGVLTIAKRIFTIKCLVLTILSML